MPNAPSPIAPLDTAETDRALIYRLFSDLFARELTVEMISGLSELEDERALPWTTVPQLKPIFEHIRDMAAQPAEASKDLAGVFSYLFLGVGGPNSAPPYESAYVSERGILYQEPVTAMEQTLAALNLHVIQEFPEPADHVAVELATAAALAASGGTPSQLKDFLENRLNRWLGDFADACARNDRHGFYATVAKSAAELIKTDLDRLRTNQLLD